MLHSSIDTEAHWTKSGWHGSVYGWKLHLVAELTPANAAVNEQAPALIREPPDDVRYVLGDVHYNDPWLRQLCAERSQGLVTTQRGPYPRTDGGVKVRRPFHKMRSLAMETFNEHLKGIFGVHGSVPIRWLRNT